MTVVVTGAAGFLGGVLVRELVGAGRRVRAVDLRRSPYSSDIDVDWLMASVLDEARLIDAFDGADTVYHLAGVISVTGDPDGRVWKVNVDGTATVARAALVAGVRRMVHCSSVHAFDLAAPGPISEDGVKALGESHSVYDRSKAHGEEALRRAVTADLEAVVVNPTGIIGPHDFIPSRMGRVFLALFRRRLPALLDGGFDWVDVRDVATSLVAAGDRTGASNQYLLPGHRQTIAELAHLASAVSGVPPPSLTAPMWLARAAAPLGTRISRRTGNPLWYTGESLQALGHSPIVDGGRAAVELGHRPRPIAETVADIHRFFIDHGFLEKEVPRVAGDRRETESG